MRETAAVALHRQWGGGRTGSKSARRCFMVPLRPCHGAAESALAFMKRLDRLEVLRCPCCKTGLLRVVGALPGVEHLPVPAELVPAEHRVPAGWRSPGVRHECGVLLLARRTSVKPVPEKKAPVRCWGQGCAKCRIRAKTMTGRNACTAAGRTWARAWGNLHVGQTRLHPP